MTPEIHGLSDLLRRYSFAYTATHDLSLCDELMVDDYELVMGPMSVLGRDDVYKPATAKQYRQYPGLGFTVHDLINNGERAAMHFSEHGRSVVTGNLATWRGISLYRQDGKRLTQCRVEQDYFSRSVQNRSGLPLPVPAPGHDPWQSPVLPSDASTEARIRAHLETGAFLTNPAISRDAEVTEDDVDRAGRVVVEDPMVEILDLFSAGPRAAVHLTITGSYTGGLGTEHDAQRGVTGSLYATGLFTVDDSGVSGHLVTDRLSFGRRLSRSR